MKKLSIVTVTYNCVHRIRETLESVLANKKAVAEYIIIDGGSTDGTLKLIEDYRGGIEFFTSEPDFGIYDAMNKGINVATGDWLLFLNAGDIFDSNMNLSSIEFSWPIETEFVVFSYSVDGDPNPKLPEICTRFGMPTSHQAMFISREVAKLVGFDIRYKVAADYDFYIKRYKLNNKCAHVDYRLLTKVLPGGYSKTNFDVMKKEYRQIIWKNLGLWKAVVYYCWSNIFLYRAIKKVLPINMFLKLRDRY